MQPTEQWLPIAGWDGMYSVSNLGRVRSEARVVTYASGKRQTVRQRILREATKRSGHRSVQLHRGGVRRRLHTHRLVAFEFIGPPPSPLHEVAHNDGDPSHNEVGNLRWATRRDNHMDKVAHGTHNRGNQHPNHKVTDAQVRRIRGDARPNKAIAAEYGIAWQTVWAIKTNRTRTFA